MPDPTDASASLRSRMADGAWAAWDRVALGGGGLLLGVVDVVRWPFERVAWGLERRLVWPVRERTAGWGAPARALGFAAIATLAACAVAIGAALAGVGDEGETVARDREAAPVATGLPFEEPDVPAEPALRGAAPVFVPREGVDEATATAPADAGSDASTGRAEERAVPAGPAAMKVARRFAEAFVLYEIGKKEGEAKRAFSETATPQLAKSLADRPPQLPAGAKVPKAKVLNIVPGPRRGRTYTVSVSLLRVGVTSELRLDLKKHKDSWAVTNVRG